jgi:phosphatidylglycerophosphate synthase
MGSHASLRTTVIIAVLAAFAIAGAGSAAIRATLDLGLAYPIKALMLVAIVAAMMIAGVRRGHPFETFGAANAVTTGRVALVTLVAALVGERASDDTAVAAITIAAVITAADGLDGWLARRSGTNSTFGARFDMETDALLIMALSVLTWRHGKAGAWIVLSGLLRYLFVAAGWTWPWMQRPLPPRFRRKTICVAQIAGLLLALVPAIEPPVSIAIAAVSLALLAWSFGVDTAWLVAARGEPLARQAARNTAAGRSFPSS